MKYNIIAIGGTFDLFHKGHREFLKFALDNSQKLIIGITSEEYIKKIKNSVRDSFLTRKRNVEDFLKKCTKFEQIELISINDVFGPTLDKDFKIDALFVTEESKSGAQIINEERFKRKLDKFPIIIFPFVKAQDGKIISSTRIRNGEINREGMVYCKSVWLKSSIALPDSLRAKLREPIGDLLKEENIEGVDFSRIITVGDEVTKRFNTLNYKQKFSAVDFYIKRKEKFKDLKELGFSGTEKIIKVNNPAGSITPALFKSIIKIFSYKISNRVIFKIRGEEDLAVLPFIIAAPLGFMLFYGQPDHGIVKVEISEENKEKAFDFLDKFIPTTRGY